MSTTVVVGAGIVGASVAYHLARRGVPVTLIDRAPSPASGVTGASFAWIGGSGGGWPGGAEDLRGSVLPDYRRLETELPAVAVRWTGSLVWTDAPKRRSTAGELGDGQQWVGRDEIRALEPNLLRPPEWAVYTPSDGGVDAVGMTCTLVNAARDLGAHVLLGSAVDTLRIVDGQVDGVVSAGSFHPASTVVLAAGTASRSLSEPLGAILPVEASPAVLLRVAAPPGLVTTVVASPAFEVRELRDGKLLLTAPHDDDLSPPALDRLADRTLLRLQASFRGAASARLIEWRLGHRPMPANGPLVGYLTPDRSVYLAVMHSAVTLGPTVGRLVAQEIATGRPVAELQRCRPAG